MGRRKRSKGGPIRERSPLVHWTERVRDVVALLRAYGKENAPDAIGEALRARFGPDASPGAADVEQTIDDVIFSPDSAPDGRSVARAFGEDGEGLEPGERDQVLGWERERRRGVYVLDRARREALDAWDPLEGKHVTIHLLERLGAGRAGELRRGTVLTTVTASWYDRRFALNPVELYETEEALRLYRTEVRNSGATWHDMPPA